MDRIALRAARPEDVDAAVPLIHSSGPDAFNYVFGHAMGFLRRAYLDGAGEFGYRNQTVAVSNDNVVGIGATYSADVGPAFTAAAARQILRHYGSRAPGVIMRGLRAERVVRPPGNGLQYIAHVGVVESMRSRGIGRTLVEHFLEVGRKRGRLTAELDVAVTNPDAQRLYERLGFRVTAERTSTLRNAHGSVPNHRRMALRL